MTIAEVREVISKHRRPGHPEVVTDAAREELCLTSIQAWNGPLKTMVDTTFSMLRYAIMNIMERTLGNYKQTDLFRASKLEILRFLGQHQAQQRRALGELYELETYKMFTLNESDFLKYWAEELKMLQDARRETRVQLYVQKQAKKILTDTSRRHRERAITDDQLGPDPLRIEIETAAYARGYYKTAGLRFSDNLCQNILGNLLRKIQKEMPLLLENSLELNTRDSKTHLSVHPLLPCLPNIGELECRNLMVEGHSEVARRAALQDERTKLKYAADRPGKLVQELESTSRVDLSCGCHADES
jgi:hypothetical protein